jgi:glycosyltransferase involved in cell wall biosynthesis
MRIIINDYPGFAFPLQLSSELSRRGHSVLHLFTDASGGPPTSIKKIVNDNLKIVNIDVCRVEKDNLIKRWFQERNYGKLAVKKINEWYPDVVISGNTPLVAQKNIMSWADNNGVPTVFWLQDILSIASKFIISDFNPTLGSFVYKYFKKIEINTLSKANHIIAITDGFIPFLQQWNINPAKISIIKNWGPLEQIPVISRKNRFSDQYGLSDKFVVLYSGTLGKKQDIRLITDTVVKLAYDNEIIFVIATDVRGQKLIKQQLAVKNPANLLKLPLQSPTKYPYLLASSDVALVTLESTAGLYCVPSKLWSIYCAQKPSIVALDKRNLCARITENIKAGFVISPGSVNECIAAIRKLKENKMMRESMGRKARGYAEKNFPISPIADSFEAILNQVIYN